MLYTDTHRDIYRVYQCWVWFTAVGTGDHGHCCLPFGNLQAKFSSRFGRTSLSSTGVLHLLGHWCPKPARCCRTTWSETVCTPSYANGIIPIFKNEAHTETASCMSWKLFNNQATSLTSTVVLEESECVRIHINVLWGEFLQNSVSHSQISSSLYYKYFTQTAAYKNPSNL